ncbi:zinc-binding dehydrogenase [Mycetocola tolaasinivorans]|nr:zinc-binding dehydrogenase [Mycetocola tolaasinivorans]
MRAIISSEDAPFGLILAETDRPLPAPDEVLVRVSAASLNYGTVAYRDPRETGKIKGSDGAGTVIAAAANGSGPRVGERICFATPHGSFAEICSVPVAYAAPIPAGVSDAEAAALPGAGLTALQAVRRLGSGDGLRNLPRTGVNESLILGHQLSGKRVLVTGAAGGVGVFAIQLLAAAGAEVITWVGRPERGEGLADLGASVVISSAEQLGDTRVDAVLDTVGGAVLTRALSALADYGLALNIGFTSGEPSVIDIEAIRRLGPGRRLEAFVCTDVGSASLSELLELTARGLLRVPLAPLTPWTRYAEAVDDLLGRRVWGKSVLLIDPETAEETPANN